MKRDKYLQNEVDNLICEDIQADEFLNAAHLQIEQNCAERGRPALSDGNSVTVKGKPRHKIITILFGIFIVIGVLARWIFYKIFKRK